MAGFNFDASWWMKIRRADQHLEHIDRLLTEMREPNSRTIHVEKHRDVGRWRYTTHHNLTPSPDLPLVVGDCLFNLRSALDHIAAFNSSGPHHTKGLFPIFTDDFRQFRSDEPERFKKYRESWRNFRKHCPPRVFAVIESAQPFVTALKDASNPEDAALAVLNTFHNADKHSALTMVDAGVINPEGFVVHPDGSRSPITYPPIPPDAMVKDGATVFISDTEMNVEFRGTIQVAIAGGPDHRYLPTEGLRWIRGEVIAVLEEITRAM